MTGAAHHPADRFADAVGMGRGSGRDVLAARQAEADRLAAERARAGLDVSDLDALLRVLSALSAEEIAADPPLRQALEDLPNQLYKGTAWRWLQSAFIDTLLLEGLDLPPLMGPARQQLAQAIANYFEFSGRPSWAIDLAAVHNRTDWLVLRELAAVLADRSIREPVAVLRLVLGDAGYKSLLRESGRLRGKRRLKSASLTDWKMMWEGTLGANQFRDALRPMGPHHQLNREHMQVRARAAAQTYLMFRS